MGYIGNFNLRQKQYKPDNQQPQHTSSRVVELATQINAWHDTRSIPERWQPVQLGRLSAQLNASRELTAMALSYTGWIEKRSGSYSLWQPR